MDSVQDPITGLEKISQILNKSHDTLPSVAKMSSSDPNTKINLLDTPNQIKKKINRVYCVPGNITDNSLIPLLEHIIFPCLNMTPFIINRSESNGGDISYDKLYNLIKDFELEILHPGDLKNGIAQYIIKLLAPVRECFKSRENTKLFAKSF